MSEIKGRFDALCEKYRDWSRHGESIGTYKEKRLHVILKELACDSAECYEVKVGKYVADVFCDGEITEIQTGSFYPLRAKLSYYLAETDHRITVIHPIIASKRIIRIDAETGEVIRSRMSPRRVKSGEIFKELSWVAEHLSNERLRIVILYVSADEYRYSDEAVRYRRSGRYDSELFPRELIGSEVFCGAGAYRELLQDCPEVFSAREFGALRKMSGRELYATLKLLCEIGALSKRKRDSRTYEYLIEKTAFFETENR